MCRAINSISINAVLLARDVAADESKVKQLAYDNFNWVSHTWEPSATHGNLTHDEVSALLFVLKIPEGSNSPTVAEVTDLQAFRDAAGARHRMSPSDSLTSILPSKGDQLIFRSNAVIHVRKILSEEIHSFSSFCSHIPKIWDPTALKAETSEEHYLPTFDQEQGST
jgi:hypothetical protein